MSVDNWIQTAGKIICDPERNMTVKARAENIVRVIELANIQAVIYYGVNDLAHVKRAYNYLIKLYIKNPVNKEVGELLKIVDGLLPVNVASS